MFNKLFGFAIMAFASVNASHFDNIDEIEKFEFDFVSFLTKKDCALDNYPPMRQFLEVESAHYKKLDVRIASEGQSRITLYNKGKVVDEIHIYKFDIESVRELMEKLGLERDESVTWKTRDAEAKLADAFMNPNRGGDKKKEEL